jgi:hypothetical protein
VEQGNWWRKGEKEKDDAEMGGKAGEGNEGGSTGVKGKAGKRKEGGNKAERRRGRKDAEAVLFCPFTRDSKLKKELAISGKGAKQNCLSILSTSPPFCLISSLFTFACLTLYSCTPSFISLPCLSSHFCIILLLLSLPPPITLLHNLL